MNSELLDHFVLSHRSAKNRLDPYRAYASLWEEEIDATGELLPTAVIFLTNRECPFKCVMCDLWKNTLDDGVPRGAIAKQIEAALDGLPEARQIKLYNAGSFFDPAAIPPEEDAQVAKLLDRFDRVVVESHPTFLAGSHAERCLRFRDLISGRLEVAIGLETAHPDVLSRLNKKMTLDSFARAARFLDDNDVALRVFVLLSPPYMPTAQTVEWACRSVDLAAECSATAAVIIPTRGGNGTLEVLGREFVPPRLSQLESAVEYGLSLPGMRVFADLWDIERFFDCECARQRAQRLAMINREQRVPPPIACACDARST